MGYPPKKEGKTLVVCESVSTYIQNDLESTLNCTIVSPLREKQLSEH